MGAVSGRPSRQTVAISSLSGRVWTIDARGPAQSAAPAWDEEVDGVGDVVAEVQQRERAVVGEERVGAANGHPRLAHVVVLGGWESLDAVQPAANALEAPTAHVVVKELAADPVRAGLAGVEVAALLVCLGLQTQHIRL